MKNFKAIMSVLTALLFAVVFGLTAEATVGLPAEVVGGILLGLGAIPVSGGFAMMAIQKEMWLQDIVPTLYKKSPHLQYAFNADAFVLEGKVVHIPNAGSVTDPERNRSSLPATVVTRTDADITFSIDEFTTSPVLVKNAEKYELSYDKRQSVIGMHLNDLAELVGDWFFYHWAPTTAGQIIRTTGSAVLSHTTDATGNRKAVTVADVKTAQKTMNKNSVPQGDRYAALDADMYDQLLGDLSTTQYRDFSAHQDVENGVLGKLYGFVFLDARSTVLVYDNSSTPVPSAPGAAGAAADNAAGLFWHKDAVIRALGTTEMFEDTGNPTYYGDLISALVRAGGRKRRNDAKGVVALVQAASA